MEKIINGHTYKLRPYTHLEQTVIDDETVRVTEEGSKLDRGLLMSLTCFFAIESWDLKDQDKPVPLSLPQNKIKTDIGLPRLNYESYLDFTRVFPPRDRQEVFLEASKLNRLGEQEGNSLSGPSAEISGTAK